MMYFRDVLELLDLIIREMLGVPIFAAFLGGFVMAAIFGITLMLKNAAGGRSRRGR